MPLLFKLNGPDSAKLAVWEITETESELEAQLNYSATMKEQLRPITNPARRLEWMASRLLVQLLTHYDANVIHSDCGQPSVRESDLNLSITHTRGYAAVLISPEKPVGIDIEHPSPRIVKLAGRFVNQHEEKQIANMSRETGCALVWCAKEAVYKALDVPGIIFKDDITIDKLSDKPEGSLHAQVLHGKINEGFELQYIESPQYYLVWYW